jgi:S-adenosylmethionine decarboxylase
MLIAQEPIGRAGYEASGAWGISTAIDIYGCDPATIRNQDHIARFTRELCDLLRVKRFGETQVVRFGDDPRVYGYSMIQLIGSVYGINCGSAAVDVYGHLMVQLIEASLVSGHFAEASNTVYLDIFSCKWYDAEAAAAFAREFFRGERTRVQTCLRQ